MKEDKEYPILFVALDYDKQSKIYKMAEKLSNVEGNFGFKINLDFIRKPWRRSLKFLKREFQKPIFADMKMANGSRTMTSATKGLTKEEVDFTNIHAFMDEEMKKTIESTKNEDIKIFGLTVLTHFTEDYCQKFFRRSLPDTVRLFTEVSCEAGCDGIILPGTMLWVVRRLPIHKVTPGLRPKGYKEDERHKEKVSHIETIELGATSGVMGSPITKSENPEEELRKILKEMKEARVKTLKNQ